MDLVRTLSENLNSKFNFRVMKPRNLTTKYKVIQPHMCNFPYEWEILIFLKPELNLFRLGPGKCFIMTKRFKIDPINCNRIAVTHLHWLQSDAEGHLRNLCTLRVLFLSALLPPDPSHCVLDIKNGCNFSCWSCLLG